MLKGVPPHSKFDPRCTDLLVPTHFFQFALRFPIVRTSQFLWPFSCLMLCLVPTGPRLCPPMHVVFSLGVLPCLRVRRFRGIFFHFHPPGLDSHSLLSLLVILFLPPHFFPLWFPRWSGFLCHHLSPPPPRFCFCLCRGNSLVLFFQRGWHFLFCACVTSQKPLFSLSHWFFFGFFSFFLLFFALSTHCPSPPPQSFRASVSFYDTP